MLLSVLAIKLESKGPAIFKQERVGKDGRPFKIYKLRGMDYQGKYFTKTGAFLRKFSLDELPQLFNVLKGDMSLVGPRPYLISDLKKMLTSDSHSARRLAVRPGTSLMYSEIKSGFGEEAISTEKDYLENWNLLLDLKTIFHILAKMITGKNH